MTSTCPVCGEEYSTAGSLRDHAWDDHGACHLCGEQFDGERDLHVHWLAVHDVELSKAARKRAESDVGSLTARDYLAGGDAVGAATRTTTGRRAVLAAGGLALAGVGGAWATGMFGGDSEPSPGGNSDLSADALSAPAIGPADASVVVRAWEDFQCPHCADFHEYAKPKLQEQYVSGGDVRYEQHDFPIPVGQLSWQTASAARSVQDAAGDEGFWTFVDAVYDQQSDLDYSVIRDAAEQAGADPDTVENHARDQYWRPVVEADRTAGADRGVEGTPTVFVNDTQIGGSSLSDLYENIAAEIDAQLDG